MLLQSLRLHRQASYTIIILLITLALIRNVNAANQAEIKVSTEPEGIFYKITLGESLKSVTFHLMEATGEHSAPVIFFTDGLRGESATRRIEAESINITRGENYEDATQEFLLKRNEFVKITIEVDTQNAEPDVYKGKITIHSNNATDVEVPLKIEVSKAMWVPAICNIGGVVLGLAFTILGIVFPKIRAKKEEIKKDKKIIWKVATEGWENQLKAIFAFFGMLIVLFFVTFTAYYPQITAFGANPLFDYGSAFLFGFTQVGASKITADAFKS